MRKLFLLILSFIFLGGAVTGSALLLSGCDSVQTETSGGDSQDEILNENQNGEAPEKDESVQGYANSIKFIYRSYEGYSSYEPTILVACDNGDSQQILDSNNFEHTFENVGTQPQISIGIWTPAGQNYTVGMTVNGSTMSQDIISGQMFTGKIPVPSGQTIIYIDIAHFAYVQYNANGGSGSMSPDKVYSTGSSGGTYVVEDCKFTNGSADFLGWATSPSGGVAYEPGDRVSNCWGLDLYAVWDVTTYTNYYYYRTSSGTTTSSKTQTHTGTFTTYTASDISGEYTSNGWRINMWGTSSTTTSQGYNTNETITPNMGRTFYAVSIREVSIEYSTGSGSSVSDTTGYYQRWNQYGNRYSNPNLTISSTRPTRSGYTFEGWATSSGSSTVSYDPGDSYTFSRTYSQTASVTLYAVWEKSTYDATLNVKFVRNYGTYNVSLSVSGTGLATRSISEGGTATFTYETDGSASSITVTVRETSPSPNYFYVGTSSTPTRLSSYSFTWDRNSDKTVNIYTEQRYTITYNGNGSTSGSTSPTYYRYNSWPTIASNGFSRTGYTFAGWSTTSNGGVDYRPGNSYTENGYPTLYAVWNRITYTITYNGNGHTGGGMDPTTKYYGTSVMLRANAFTRTGYHFTGWSTTSSGSVAYGDQAYYSINSSVTLYAVWAVNTYYVSFQPNGASGSAYTQSFTWGVSTTLTANRFTRTGYNFLGWSVGSVSAGVSYGDMATVSNLTSSNGGTVYFYAQWEAKVQAKYDSVGGYWYVENGKMPQTRVTSSSLITNINNSTTWGQTYYFAGQSVRAKTYGGTEYCQWNGNWYEVEPIKWRLTSDPNQTTGYVSTSPINAVLAEIVYVDQYSSIELNAGAGYSTEAVSEFLQNGISTQYLDGTYSYTVENFGDGTTFITTTTTTAQVLVASESEINAVAGTTAIEFSDLAKDIIKYYGGTNVYFTRDLGSNYNNIICYNEAGFDSQRFATEYRGVQFTLRFTEYTCVA